MISKVVFAAGGTGGHLFPAIAVADALKKVNNDADIRFIGAKGKIEEKIVPQNGYKLKTLEIEGFKRSISPKNIQVINKLRKAIKESKKYLDEFEPEAVFGTGGFVSGPVLWASCKMGIPSIIQEGNYYPGITVRLVSKKVNKVIINFEGTKKFLKRQDNIELMSYPVRENLKKFSKTESAAFFGLEDNKKILFVLGGSQGASSINNILIKNLDVLIKNNIQIIWQTGKKDYESVKSTVNCYPQIKPVVFIDKIDYAYSAADLILCRAGISTIMELAYFGAAAIFVPYAFASDNHQEKNARAVARQNAAEIILESELSSKLIDKVFSLINNDGHLYEMQENIKKISDKNAADKIVQLLIDETNKHFN